MTEHSPSTLKRLVKEKAVLLGFDLVGVTTPDPPPHLDVFHQWIHLNRHGEMGYLARQRNLDRRSDPRIILPECQSILVLGMNYLPLETTAARSGNPAQLATYALGDDYHDIIPRKLDVLVASIEAWLGRKVAHRYYTDTGPILERELAQRAGLGWIGKNTCLINPKQGSYYFLAELLLGVELPADNPMTTDHCGSCTRCLEACPTQCILSDRTLDARRCISYLTIELKSEIPENLRDQLGHWIFGCDVCQQVCPWNQRFATPTEEQSFQARPIFDNPKPESFLTMSDQEFQETFRGSPLKRAKRRGLARNAATVAGNRADPSSIDVLRQTLLSDPEPLVRQHAAWALGRFEHASSQAALRLALETEHSEAVQREIQDALTEHSQRK